MKIEIEGLSQEEALKEIRSLKKWLEDAEIEDLENIDQSRQKLKEDEAGGLLDPELILTFLQDPDIITMAGGALVKGIAGEIGKELFQSAKAWYAMRKKQNPDMKLVLKDDNGNSGYLSEED